MTREEMKPNMGRFFLTQKTRYGTQYYRESGAFDVGGEREETFLYWTKYPREAFGFRTLKRAKAMAAKLLSVYGARTTIVRADGTVVC